MTKFLIIFQANSCKFYPISKLQSYLFLSIYLFIALTAFFCSWHYFCFALTGNQYSSNKCDSKETIERGSKREKFDISVAIFLKLNNYWNQELLRILNAPVLFKPIV